MIMKNKVLTLLLSMLCICNIYAEDDKIPIPPDQKWSDTNDRDNSSPELYQSESSVYVYYEKQLDNVACTASSGSDWNVGYHFNSTRKIARQ